MNHVVLGFPNPWPLLVGIGSVLLLAGAVALVVKYMPPDEEAVIDEYDEDLGPLCFVCGKLWGVMCSWEVVQLSCDCLDTPMYSDDWLRRHDAMLDKQVTPHPYEPVDLEAGRCAACGLQWEKGSHEPPAPGHPPSALKDTAREEGIGGFAGLPRLDKDNAPT